MVSPSLLVEARRRAGFSQRELAARAGIGQQEIARYERGHVTPSLERLRRLVSACGLELTFGLARADASYDDAILQMLALPPAQRLARGLRDAASARAVGAEARGRRASTRGAAPPPDAVDVLRILEKTGLRYVLIGELAEVLRGSPLLPTGGVVSIVPRAGEGEALRDTLTIGRGHKVSGSEQWPPDTAERWRLEIFCADLVISPAPPGTHGYEDLHRDATQLHIETSGPSVMVASLVDLVRIGEAANDRARMSALRRTLELSNSDASMRSARAA